MEFFKYYLICLAAYAIWAVARRLWFKWSPLTMKARAYAEVHKFQSDKIRIRDKEWAPWTEKQENGSRKAINEMFRCWREYVQIGRRPYVWGDITAKIQLLLQLREQFRIICRFSDSYEAWLALYHQSPDFCLVWKRRFLKKGIRMARESESKCEELMLLVALHHPRDLPAFVRLMKEQLVLFFEGRTSRGDTAVVFPETLADN